MKEAVGASQSSPPSPAPGVIRFGNFEVDTRAGELRRNGIKLRLSGQPFDVLLALLEKPGQVVTREELHDKLWSQDTFVDFEQGLNKAINKVREALGDNADNPRFIETLPRRGYRFLAPVTNSVDALSPVEDTRVDPAVRTSPSTPTIRSKFSRNLWISVLAVSVLVGVALLTISTDRSPKVLRYTQLTHDGLQKGIYLVTDGSRIYFGEVDSQWRPLVAEVSYRWRHGHYGGDFAGCFFLSAGLFPGTLRAFGVFLHQPIPTFGAEYSRGRVAAPSGEFRSTYLGESSKTIFGFGQD